jgi:PPOX class probable F420-dependent enzyme
VRRSLERLRPIGEEPLLTEVATRGKLGRPALSCMLSQTESAFIAAHRVARLATADTGGVPHVVPVCFALLDESLYITIDGKPKRATGRPLKRLANIAANPAVTLLVDRYDEDWGRLGWVMVRGRAEILAQGAEHDRAQDALRARYPQYRTMALDDLPVIAIRVSRVTSWGNLDPA